MFNEKTNKIAICHKNSAKSLHKPTKMTTFATYYLTISINDKRKECHGRFKFILKDYVLP